MSYDKSYTHQTYCSEWDLRRGALLDRLLADTICVDDYFTLETGLIELVMAAAELMRQLEAIKSVQIEGFSSTEYFLHFAAAEPLGLVRILKGTEGDPLACERARYLVSTCGERDISRTIIEKFRERFGVKKLARVLWWWLEKGEPKRRAIVLDKPKPVYREFYPWIGDDIDEYLDRYLASEASLLFMTGPAGTGKTSLIRYFIHRKHLGSMVTYEDALLETDAMFVDFLTSKSESVLVVEDADLMLSSRQHAGNKLVARFLSISDGVVKFSGKKMIFTTNLDDCRNIDAALLRPGRCFDVLHFRPLTHSESIAAAKVAELQIPAAQGDYTLAQLFNQSRELKIMKRRVGFSL
jgi:ATPase family associated with various cellular activities (AAA)